MSRWRSCSATPATCATRRAGRRRSPWSRATTPRSRRSWPTCVPQANRPPSPGAACRCLVIAPKGAQLLVSWAPFVFPGYNRRQGMDNRPTLKGRAMPIHDWTRVDAGLFHAFHQTWTITLCNALNAGGLPPGYFALAEQPVRGPLLDFLALDLPPNSAEPSSGSVGLVIAVAAPQTRVVMRAEADQYTGKANCITVRQSYGQAVAVIEIVSPGNKGSWASFRPFIEKLTDLIR